MRRLYPTWNPPLLYLFGGGSLSSIPNRRKSDKNPSSSLCLTIAQVVVADRVISIRAMAQVCRYKSKCPSIIGFTRSVAQFVQLPCAIATIHRISVAACSVVGSPAVYIGMTRHIKQGPLRAAPGSLQDDLLAFAWQDKGITLPASLAPYMGVQVAIRSSMEI